jgi:hypothetical protein
MRRIRGDAGVVGGVEVLPFGVLTFLVGSLLVANAWAVVDAKLMVSSAAHAAARAYVEAPDAPTARAEATRAVTEAASSYGRDPAKISVRVEHEDGRAWRRCVRVLVTVDYPIDVVALPWIGGFGHGFHPTSTQSEIIDPYRAGLPGAVAC